MSWMEMKKEFEKLLTDAQKFDFSEYKTASDIQHAINQLKAPIEAINSKVVITSTLQHELKKKYADKIDLILQKLVNKKDELYKEKLLTIDQVLERHFPHQPTVTKLVCDTIRSLSTKSDFENLSAKFAFSWGQHDVKLHMAKLLAKFLFEEDSIDVIESRNIKSKQDFIGSKSVLVIHEKVSKITNAFIAASINEIMFKRRIVIFLTINIVPDLPIDGLAVFEDFGGTFNGFNKRVDERVRIHGYFFNLDFDDTCRKDDVDEVVGQLIFYAIGERIKDDEKVYIKRDTKLDKLVVHPNHPPRHVEKYKFKLENDKMFVADNLEK